MWDRLVSWLLRMIGREVEAKEKRDLAESEAIHKEVQDDRKREEPNG